MRSELKRALLKKSNIILIVAVVGLMIINAYYGGWRTALKIDSAQDIQNIDDIIFYKKYYKLGKIQNIFFPLWAFFLSLRS